MKKILIENSIKPSVNFIFDFNNEGSENDLDSFIDAEEEEKQSIF